MAEADNKLIKVNKWCGDEQPIPAGYEGMADEDNMNSFFEAMGDLGTIETYLTYATETDQGVKTKKTFAWNMLARAFPQATGIEFMFVWSGHYDYNYQSYMYSISHVPNPTTTAKQAAPIGEAKHTGFCALPWQMEKTKTDADLNETTAVEACNDNMVLYRLRQYQISPTAENEKACKTKFDFCMNSNYKVIKSSFTKEGDAMIIAESNAECLLFLTCTQGIVGFNWATKAYKGKRRQVGSLNDVNSKLVLLLDLLVEKDIIALKGDKFW